MKYLWRSLVRAGDYFIVPDEVDSYFHMQQAVAIRNYRYRGIFKYECRRMEGQTLIVLAVLLGSYKPERFEYKGTVFLQE